MAPRKLVKRKKIERRERPSLLVVVEGETEQAFCLYLERSLSHKMGKHISIENAQGGSPACIIRRAQTLVWHKGYDHLVIIFDSDRPIEGTGAAEAKKFLKMKRGPKRIPPEVIVFSPCIEGFFLRLLKHPVLENTDACKKRLRKVGLKDSEKLEASSYEKLFPQVDFPTLCCDPQFKRLYQLFANER